MNFVIWLLIGGLLGWAASLFTGTNARTAIPVNVVVGIIGVMLGGWLLGGLLDSSQFTQGEFSVASLLVASLGAMVLLAAVHLIVGIATRQPPTTPRLDLVRYSRFPLQKPANRVSEPK
jgi:uncharacterized membrane protein YeaQ/YmgE (transglycosylase-associated protein family)